MLSTLARVSLDGAILVTLVWIVTRAMPGLSPATRTTLWWCAAAKFVVALIWVTPLQMRILPPDNSVMSEGLPAAMARVTGNPEGLRVVPTDAGGAANPLAVWPAVVLGIWAGGLLIAAAIAWRRWQQTRQAIGRSTPAPPGLQAIAIALAERLGLGRVPDVRTSTDVDTPLVAGLRRPVVLLPDGPFARLTEQQQRMVLCHELAHVKRADLWLGCVPAIAERVFFFHPLVHVAVREYVFWREAACDAAVIESLDAAPQEYGRLLLDLGVARPRTLAAAGASWSFLNLKRRIAMLRTRRTGSFGTRLLGAASVALSIAAMVPVQLAARPSPAVASVVSMTGDTSRAAAAEPEAQRDRDLNFVLFFDADTTTMSGSTRDIARARQFRRSGERLLWFRRDGREYIVRDPGVLDQVIAIWEPVSALGNEQGWLGTKQGELGTKQGEIGTRQGEIGTEQGKLGTRQGVLGTRQGVLASRERDRASEAENESLERERRDIEREMQELDREMRALDAKIRELDKPMRELSEQMEFLDREMQVLGRKMEEASRKAHSDMRTLLERAIAGGTAELVK